MLKYIFFLSMIIGLVSCSQPDRTNNDKNQAAESVVEKQVIAKTEKQTPVFTASIDKNTIRIALKNKDSVRASQKIKLDKRLEDVGQRYAMQDAMGKFKKGVTLFDQQDFNAALEQFKLALANIPENSKVNYYLGVIYYQFGQKDLAFSYYSDAVKFDPLDSLALLGIGQIYFDHRDLVNAYDFYDFSIQAGPKYSSAYYNRGTLLGMQKKYPEALSDLNKAIELNPNLGNAYVNRGNTYFLLDDHEAACSDWKKAASLGEANGLAAVEQHCQ